jgi:hypothetical protein
VCATLAVITIDPADHVEWARGIARTVRRAWHYAPGSQEEADLESEAVLCVCESAAAYEPARAVKTGDHFGAFRGWCKRDVQTACVREAERLRNGGTYNTRRRKPGREPIRVREFDLRFHDVDEKGYTEEDLETIASEPVAPMPETKTDVMVSEFDAKFAVIKQELDRLSRVARDMETIREHIVKIAPLCELHPEAMDAVLSQLQPKKGRVR